MEMNGTIKINRPVETVFDYVIHIPNDVNWRQGITESNLREGQTLGPGALGYSRAGDVEVDWRVISYVPGESVDYEFLNGPYKGRGGYHAAPAGDGTQFTLVAEIEPTGLYKLLGPLFAWMGRRRNQADVEKLRDILESPSP